MIKVLFVVFLSAFSIVAEAQSNNAINSVSPEQQKIEWKHYIISTPIDPNGVYITKDSIDNVFRGKEIIIDNKSVIIRNVCEFEYNKLEKKPLNYWHGQKTVELYKEFFSKYNLDVNDGITLFTSKNGVSSCDYPFSYFIKINDSLVMILKNRAVIYTQNNAEHKDTNINCVQKQQTIEQVYGDGTIEECMYKKMTLLDAYSKYRNSLSGEERKNLSASLNLNHDFTSQCDNNCDAVSYKWNSAKKLIVTQSFPGGVTEISFSEGSNGCLVVTKNIPD
ncbi:hypothetical protein DA103_13175 [Enterobacter cloacae]|uniref:Uncharacterized protein n=1 Tax=Enterobacter cloacae TaxID=550 RepID=A0A2T4XXX8_ENTCL|nr:hypothetical protein [Enterobacter cloacae]PTM34777.1 hypothetical protein DA103_13175 [Enterobacter cloacae]